MDVLAETLKGLTIDSTIKYYAYYDSDENDAEGNPKSDPLLDTHTSDGKKIKVTDTDTINGNSPQKLLINRTLPIIVPLIYPRIPGGVADVRGTMHTRQMLTSKVIVTDTTCSCARIFQTHGDVSRMGRDGTTPRDGKTSIRSPRLNYPVLNVAGTTISPTRMEIQEIGSSKGTTSSVEFSNAQIFHTSIHRNLTKNGDLTPTFSKIIGRELFHNSSADIYSCCRVNFTLNSVGTKIPGFVNLGLLDVHASYEIGSFGTPATRVGSLTDGSSWSTPGLVLGEATAVEMSGTRSEQNYSSKTYFETKKENQDFGRQNIFMSRPPLDSTPFGTNTTN